jgi:excisionase family DNA binding protein
MTGPYLSIAEAGQYLGVSVKTIRRRLAAIPHVRCDWGLRFSKNDLDGFMSARRVEPAKSRKADPDRILAGLGIGRGGRRKNG